ncbi:Fe-only nitrogenase accessory AnfO family protein [Clostridium saccharobutylicum]|uniref:Iron only nitrogenase protein AnfO n=1 Tax=Clostridium saccharobutylicum TaxID=169679 RepID=A0A1S8MYA1_CLOSA|nr:Fe-only nitrogenase accessory AnfO family protein [Clostridium saccharobutylicum]OOM09150.1 iron only nitrogenase protein AnfO [Clostridium saccharobutylicum]
MNDIAVFLEEKDIISSFENAKYVKIFTKDNYMWKVRKVILINRTSCSSGINEIRKEYQSLLEQINDCKIVVVTKAFGIPYSVFYMEDFSVWELEGNPMDFLDEIVVSENEKEELDKQEVEVAKKIEEGYYFVDLQELELTNPEMTSKKAIIPYLQKEDVKKIEVSCCHVPPWLIAKKEKGEFTLEINEVSRNNYKVIIEK